MNYIFVADQFKNNITGGAELCLDTLISAKPNIIKLYSNKVNSELIDKYKDDIWIFGNYSQLNIDLISSSNIKYYIIEFDYKFCELRQPDSHYCSCKTKKHGKKILSFLNKAISVFFMSTAQYEMHGIKNGIVMAAPFSLHEINLLREQRNNNRERNGWAVLHSNLWRKGTRESMRWCTKKKYFVKLIKNMRYDNYVRFLGGVEGLCFLPNGIDSCPRIVTEAKLAGCKLNINDKVQQATEKWFSLDFDDMEKYLLETTNVFWNTICRTE
jgi:hypothetical protein